MDSFKHNLIEYKNKNPLTLKLLVSILLFSSVFAVFATAFQLYLDYKRDVGQIEKQIKLIGSLYVKPLAEHVWGVDKLQAEIVLTSILNLPDVQYVELVDSTTEITIHLGGKTDLNSLDHRFALEHVISKSETVHLGYVSINTTLDNVYSRLRERVLIILVTQAVKTFCVSLFIFLITYHLITRHLATISKHATAINLNTLDHSLELRRKPSRASKPDELDQVVSSLNDMHARILSEISAGKITEEALRESEERFRQVAMTNWVWEVDLEGRYTYCSENVIDTLGYSREEIIGKTPFDFMSQEEASRVGEIFTELIASRKRIIDLENWNVTKNGSEICLLTNGAPFYDKAGNFIGYRGGDKDITDRKRAEVELVKHQDQLELLVEDRTLELKEAQAELIQSERLATLGRLTATVSHEIRNPLGTIQTALFSIEDSLERNDSSQVARSLELADRSISRCVTIIEELNSYARVKDLDISETSIDDWLRAVFNEERIPDEISYELDLSSDVRASVDHEKLRQVVVNLIANAVHALQDKQSHDKHLRVSTHLLDNKYEIRISDNGIGMTSDIKEKVFEPLFSTKGFGVGLGMVIVKNIVDQHHGEIHIESKEGEGTTVTLRLPINPSGEQINQNV